MKGLYIHIPYCRSKCPYCDFYSAGFDETLSGGYCSALIDEIKTNRRTAGFTGTADLSFDTIYFGGGTPSVIGGERIGKIIEAAKEYYSISENPEITVECNPSTVDEDFFKMIESYGANRISLGLQSAVDAERRALGRLADKNQVRTAVQGAKKSGIENISLDLMLGVPNQTIQSLDESIGFCIDAGVTHISAYMLTIEENTVFFKRREKLKLPDEDTVCEMYLHTIERLESSGFHQYEISNFAKKGYESRHNLKYWNCEEYLGLGPSSHSFIKGKRFYFPRSTADFMNGKAAVFDDVGGSEEEYIILKLRLSDGLSGSEYKGRFGRNIPEKTIKKALAFEKQGLMKVTDDHISLTRNGFLVSNYVISEII